MQLEKIKFRNILITQKSAYLLRDKVKENLLGYYDLPQVAEIIDRAAR